MSTGSSVTDSIIAACREQSAKLGKLPLAAELPNVLLGCLLASDPGVALWRLSLQLYGSLPDCCVHAVRKHAASRRHRQSLHRSST
jgi:hypothetical protein